MFNIHLQSDGGQENLYKSKLASGCILFVQVCDLTCVINYWVRDVVYPFWPPRAVDKWIIGTTVTRKWFCFWACYDHVLQRLVIKRTSFPYERWNPNCTAANAKADVRMARILFGKLDLLSLKENILNFPPEKFFCSTEVMSHVVSQSLWHTLGQVNIFER